MFMQISDREEDRILDLLTVRDEVESLNEVFTDPAVVKVPFYLYGLLDSLPNCYIFRLYMLVYSGSRMTLAFILSTSLILSMRSNSLVLYLDS